MIILWQISKQNITCDEPLLNAKADVGKPIALVNSKISNLAFLQHQKIWGRILIQVLSPQFKTIRKLPDLTGDSKSIKVIKGDFNIYFSLTTYT